MNHTPSKGQDPVHVPTSNFDRISRCAAASMKVSPLKAARNAGV